jgi:alpha 1,4-glycosyltransferase
VSRAFGTDAGRCAGAEADDRAWARRLHEARRAHKWNDPDGAYCLTARMAPDAGARFDAAWEAHIDRIFHEARRAGRHEPRAAYAADALVALASEGPCKPVEVRVTVDSAALSRGHTEAGERCEIDRGGPVPVTTARALLDDARVSVMVRDGDDITAVSSPKRTIPTKLRRDRFVLAAPTFYPVHFEHALDLFEEDRHGAWWSRLGGSYAVHFWNELIRQSRLHRTGSFRRRASSNDSKLDMACEGVAGTLVGSE